MTLDGSDAMSEASVNTVELDWKEGVALNNGTQMMTAIAAISVHDAECLIQAAEAAASLSVEALCGITDAFDEKIHSVRSHKGQIKAARNIRKLLSGSHLARTSDKSFAEHQYPQDPYSLRCIPQVLGSVRDTVRHVREVVEVEINSATDNPLVFAKEGVRLKGNIPLFDYSTISMVAEPVRAIEGGFIPEELLLEEETHMEGEADELDDDVF